MQTIEFTVGEAEAALNAADKHFTHKISTANITNLLAIKREEIHHHWHKNVIFIDLPEGWDTLKPLTNKVLEYKGKNYAFLAWNSDRNEAWFMETDQVAKIV